MTAADDETTIILFTTAGCHLCEQAAAMLDHLQGQEQFRFRVDAIDIASDETLVEQYGIRIPVVKRQDSDQELGWPFSIEELASLF